MKKPLLGALSLLALALALPGRAQPAAPALAATPQYRPGYHFSPAAHWMNDPNGMVYYQGVYHLFFQYYPGAAVWGPMHWGHATSPDLVRWQEQPVALYPDSLGYIFSGSAVVDAQNTSGFGQNGQVPLVAIFTHHDPKGEQQGRQTFQNQSLAYSLDAGRTWTKYAQNPVLRNPGIRDFRDPKVSWLADSKKWVMTLATHDRITFYTSPDLKAWTKASEFGAQLGAHGGVWECPDLFPLTLRGQTYWVLLVNLNPGAPNGGSGTQYFVGNFDGQTFTPLTPDTKWADYGPDDYAGVTWSNTGGRRIFLGWLSNWDYANQVPTAPWRNATTVARELALAQVGPHIYLTSQPVNETARLFPTARTLKNITVKKEYDLTPRLPGVGDKFRLQISARQLASFALVLANDQGEELLVGYDKAANQYFIDRRKAGPASFSGKFAGRHVAPRLATAPAADLTLLVDATSVELFADHGLTVMSELFFPTARLSTLTLRAADTFKVRALSYARLAPSGR